MESSVDSKTRGDALFREEAKERSPTALVGAISLYPPRVGWQGLAIGFIVLLALILTLSGASYTKQETVSGEVVLDSPAIEVVSPRAGRIANLRVHEGDNVASGDILADVSTDISTHQGYANEDVRHSIDKRIAGLHSDQALETSQFESSKAMLSSQLTDQQLKSVVLDRQISIQTDRASSSAELYQRWKAPERTGIVSNQQLLQQKDQALQAAAELERLRGERLDLHVTISKMKDDLARLSSSHALKISQIEQEVTALKASKAAAGIGEAILIRAPITGRITAVSRKQGEVVNETERLLTILPPHTRYLVRARIPNGKVGLVKKGQRVSLRFGTFPVLQFGSVRGEIIEVSEAPSESHGSANGQPSYQAVIQLDKQFIQFEGKRFDLRTGMTSMADIAVDRRPLYEALFNLNSRDEGAR